MPYVRYKTETTKTMRELAGILGLHPSRLWRLTRERHLLEGPAIRLGRREYYDPLQVERITEHVARLRKAGTLA